MLSKPNFPIRMLATLAAAHVLAGCAMPGCATTNPGSFPPGRDTPGAEAGAPRSGRGAMDMTAMCAMYRDMHSAAPGQGPAMMERHMKGMSPEMRLQQMEMMRQRCQ
ncbi:hypothetical protein F2P45_19130 [Massilia sp. CCM 8733]|uniref:Lipoprotein n=1 Tax=Massilia mucilaginosa TaxID=2609282 RepID=A0ABX0NWL6_9BURK|nr:hypothetical protein [Massilia mucilaginosa]NHZ91115.1 hypothetical protein [Massilia mucilaginosa]